MLLFLGWRSSGWSTGRPQHECQHASRFLMHPGKRTDDRKRCRVWVPSCSGVLQPQPSKSKHSFPSNPALLPIFNRACWLKGAARHLVVYKHRQMTHGGDQHVHPHVELLPLNEEWVADVLLWTWAEHFAPYPQPHALTWVIGFGSPSEAPRIVKKHYFWP